MYKSISIKFSKTLYRVGKRGRGWVAGMEGGREIVLFVLANKTCLLVSHYGGSTNNRLIDANATRHGFRVTAVHSLCILLFKIYGNRIERERKNFQNKNCQKKKTTPWYMYRYRYIVGTHRVFWATRYRRRSTTPGRRPKPQRLVSETSCPAVDFWRATLSLRDGPAAAADRSSPRRVRPGGGSDGGVRRLFRSGTATVTVMLPRCQVRSTFVARCSCRAVVAPRSAGVRARCRVCEVWYRTPRWNNNYQYNSNGYWWELLLLSPQTGARVRRWWRKTRNVFCNDFRAFPILAYYAVVRRRRRRVRVFEWRGTGGGTYRISVDWTRVCDLYIGVPSSSLPGGGHGGHGGEPRAGKERGKERGEGDRRPAPPGTRLAARYFVCVPNVR